MKTYGGNEYVQYMGILFDKDLTLDENRVFRGTISNGLVEKNDIGDYAIFVKNVG